MSEAGVGEKAALVGVTFTCEWCNGVFDYKPGLIGSDLGVQVSVNRIGMRCVSHAAHIVDMRTSSGVGDDR